MVVENLTFITSFVLAGGTVVSVMEDPEVLCSAVLSKVKVNIHQLTSQAGRETSRSQANADVDVAQVVDAAPPSAPGHTAGR